MPARRNGALLGACSLLVSVAALAQVPPAAVDQLQVDPADPRHLVLRSNFGLMVSRNAGTSWDWRCKAGMGYAGSGEPAVAILDAGRLALGLSTGVVTADAAACDFEPASGIDANVVDIVAVPEAPRAALAVSVSFMDNSSRLWRSADSGRNFRVLGPPLPRFTALSLGLSKSSGGRVYITGLSWAGRVEGAIAVSDDSGRHFTILSIPDSDSGTQPFIAAVSPEHPDTVYLRMTGTPGTLRVSDDAGRTFREILSIPGPIQGFALSTLGDALFVSSLEAGTYRADTQSSKFERVACDGVPCLAAARDALFACGERHRQGFVVGRSLDDGKTFSVLLDTPCLAPARCGASTSVGKVCAEAWPRVAAQIGQAGTACDHAAASKPLSRACFSTDAAAVPAASRALDVRKTESRGLPQRGAGCACEVSGVPTPGSDFFALVMAWLAIIGFATRSCDGSIDRR